MEDSEGAPVSLLCPMRTTLCFRSRSPCGLRLWKRKTRGNREEFFFVGGLRARCIVNKQTSYGS